MDNIDKMVSNQIEKEEYIKVITNAIQDSDKRDNLLDIKEEDDKTIKITYLLSKKILGLFDTGIRSETPDGNIVFQFVYRITDSNPFVLFEEIRFVVNSLVKFYGPDAGEKHPMMNWILFKLTMVNGQVDDGF